LVVGRCGAVIGLVIERFGAGGFIANAVVAGPIEEPRRQAGQWCCRARQPGCALCGSGDRAWAACGNAPSAEPTAGMMPAAWSAIGAPPGLGVGASGRSCAVSR